MKKLKKYFIPLLTIAFLAIVNTACEKNINIDIPEPEIKLVVDGYIEDGGLPIVTLTRSNAYFSETTSEELFNGFVHDAEMSITVEGTSHAMTELCASQIPDSLLPLFSEFAGIVITPDSPFDFCIYTVLDPNFAGETGKSYHLNIAAEGKTLSATTTIPNIVPLDSTWFRVEGTLDSLGFIWARLTDPDTIGNAYRLYAQRINHYPDGEIKDPVFIAPFNSITDDQFFNGLSFEFNANRGELPFSTKEDDQNEEQFFFKVGDTIVVKGTSTDLRTFQFFRSYYQELFNQGSPFASPASLKSNVDGGLGFFAGYGVFLDTIVATK